MTAIVCETQSRLSIEVAAQTVRVTSAEEEVKESERTCKLRAPDASLKVKEICCGFRLFCMEKLWFVIGQVASSVEVKYWSLEANRSNVSPALKYKVMDASLLTYSINFEHHRDVTFRA